MYVCLTLGKAGIICIPESWVALEVVSEACT